MVISLAAAKAYLRVEHDDEDEVIGDLLAAAVGHVERVTGRNLSVKKERQDLAGWPARGVVKLFRGPVQEIVGVDYDPADGGLRAPLTSYRLAEGLDGALMPAFGRAFPSVLAGPGAVRIEYNAGYASGEEPPALLQAVRMLTAHWYVNREAASSGSGSSELPLAVKALMDPFCPVGIA